MTHGRDHNPVDLQHEDYGRDAALLSRYLAGRSATCPLCRHGLHGETGDRCPRCGSKLCLQVGLVRLRLGWYLTLLAGCFIGLGFSATMMAAHLVEGFASLGQVLIAGAAMLLLGVGLLLMWGRGQRLRKAGPLLRWGLAGIAWTITMAAVVGFALAGW